MGEGRDKKRAGNSLDLSKVKTYSLKDRKSKVRVEDSAKPYRAGSDFNTFFSSLPDILAARDLRGVASAIVTARKKGRPVILAMGAHLIKVGLNPVIIDMMERGIITAIAMNGAGIIHDFELAFAGKTSEDVADEIKSGSFGMAEETGRILNLAIKEGVKKGKGIGEAVGERISTEDFPYKSMSILSAGERLDIPVTVHVAVGTDIIHIHPTADGASIGEGTMRDFHRFVSIVSQLEGGVYLNIGSAVLLPEVFLKALSLVRNLGHKVADFTTVNMDFIQHYRPLTNVVRRPTQAGGRGYALTGHHEIMVPLLSAAVIEEMKKGGR